MFNRYAIGVRAHADGVGVKQSNVSFQAVRGISAINALLKVSPDNADYQTRRANVLTNLCIALQDLGRGRDSIPLYEESIATLRNVLAKNSTSNWATDEMGMALHDYSSMLRALGQIEAANAAFQEAFDLRLAAYQRNPKSVFTRMFLARMYVGQGQLDRVQRRYDASIAQFQKAIDVLQPSVEEYPDIYDYHRNLLDALIEQLNTCLLTGNAEVGKPLWERFSIRLQTAWEKFPRDAFVAEKTSEWQFHWADHLRESQQDAKAGIVLKSAMQASMVLPTLPTQSKSNGDALLLNIPRTA